MIQQNALFTKMNMFHLDSFQEYDHESIHRSSFDSQYTLKPPTHTHTHTHTFNSPFSGTTWVGRYQKGKTNLNFTEARDSEWQWYQLGHMQVCTSLQTENHASNPPLSFLQAGCPSCRRPTNSVEALFGKKIYYISFHVKDICCMHQNYSEAQINHLLAMISTNTKQLVLNLVNAAVLQEVQSTGKPVQLAHDGVLFTSLLS